MTYKCALMRFDKVGLRAGGKFPKRDRAAEVTGIDIPAEMIRLAEQSESRTPLACTYLNQDVATFEPAGTVGPVVAR